MRLKFALLCAATLFSLDVSARASDDPKPADGPPPASVKVDVARGDQWIYEQRDGLTDELKFVVSYVVTDVSDSEIDSRVRFKNPTANTENTSLQTWLRP
jgi:hypothetical protein